MSLLIIFVLISQVFSHSMWTCPKPRVDDSGLKTGPCGGMSGGAITRISPGPLTVFFKETIFHKGAPFRIALSLPGEDDFESCVLLDHIPHDDGGLVNDIYGITINIPNFNCNNCALQVIQFMTDKVDGSCVFNPIDTTSFENNQCGSNYFSCANVQIKGTEPFNISKCVQPDGFKQNSFYTSFETSLWTKNADKTKYLTSLGSEITRSFVENGVCFPDGTQAVAPVIIESNPNIGVIFGILGGVGLAAVSIVGVYRYRKMQERNSLSKFSRLSMLGSSGKKSSFTTAFSSSGAAATTTNKQTFIGSLNASSEKFSDFIKSSELALNRAAEEAKKKISSSTSNGQAFIASARTKSGNLKNKAANLLMKSSSPPTVEESPVEIQELTSTSARSPAWVVSTNGPAYAQEDSEGRLKSYNPIEYERKNRMSNKPFQNQAESGSLERRPPVGTNSSNLAKLMSKTSGGRRETDESSFAAYANQGETFPFVIIGFGVAGAYAARQFSDLGLPQYQLCLIGEEPTPGYERKVLSKGYLFPTKNPAKPPLRLPQFYCGYESGTPQTDQWYFERNWPCYLKTRVASIDVENKIIKLEDSPVEIGFEKLIVCTGSRPIKLAGPGAKLNGIFYIRNEVEASRLVSRMESRGLQVGYGTNRVVVLGGGALGVEIATSMTAWGYNQVCLAFHGDYLYNKMPWPIEFIVKMQKEILRRANCLQLYPNNSIKKIVAISATSPHDLGRVVLTNGTVIETQTLVSCVGSTSCGKELFPNGEFSFDPNTLKATNDIWVCGETVDKNCGAEMAQQMGQYAARSAFHEFLTQDDPQQQKEEIEKFKPTRLFRSSKLFGESSDPLVWYQIGKIEKETERYSFFGKNNTPGVSGVFATIHYDEMNQIYGIVVCGSIKDEGFMKILQKEVEKSDFSLDDASSLFIKHGYSM